MPQKSKQEARVCKLCAGTCCDKPSKVGFDHLAHKEHRDADLEIDVETQWWFQCYGCDTICRCEV